jgi:hypothetical protein
VVAVSVHEQLRVLVRRYGPGVLHSGEDLRGVLDDFFAEGEVTAGELNLLVDAVRLQAFSRLEMLLAQGADPRSAVEAAGQGLAQERSGDPRTAAWACAALGFAVGRVPEAVVLSYVGTGRPRGPHPSGPPGPLSGHPGAARPPSPGAPPTVAPPPTSPPWQQPTHPPPQPPRPNRRGLVAGIAAAVVLVLVAVVVVVVLTRGDGDPAADDDPTSSREDTDSAGPGDDPSDDPSDDAGDDADDDVPAPGTPVSRTELATTFASLGSTVGADVDACELLAAEPGATERVRCRYGHLRVVYTTYADADAFTEARAEREAALEALDAETAESRISDRAAYLLAATADTTWLYWDAAEGLQSGYVSAKPARLSANAARNWFDQRGEGAAERVREPAVRPFGSPALWELARFYVGDQARGGRVRGCVDNPNPDPDFEQVQRVQCTDGAFELTFVQVPEGGLAAAREHFGAPADSRITWDWLGQSELTYPVAGDYYLTYTDRGVPILYWDDGAQEVYGFVIPPDGDHARAEAYWSTGDASTS